MTLLEWVGLFGEVSGFGDPSYRKTMVDLRINETLQTGAVANRTYRVGLNAVRLKTAPTGLG